MSMERYDGPELNRWVSPPVLTRKERQLRWDIQQRMLLERLEHWKKLARYDLYRDMKRHQARDHVEMMQLMTSAIAQNDNPLLTPTFMNWWESWVQGSNERCG